MADRSHSDRVLVASHELVLGLERQLDDAKEHRARQFALAADRGLTSQAIAGLIREPSANGVPAIVRFGRHALAELRRRRARDEHEARHHTAPPREEAATT